MGQKKGYKQTKQHTERIRQAAVKNWQYPRRESLKNAAEVSRLRVKEKNPNWKGDNASYYAKHDWISRKFGRATMCEICGIDKIPEGKKRYFQWANLDHKYSRKTEDYKQMCCSCHSKYDIKYNKKFAKRTTKTNGLIK